MITKLTAERIWDALGQAGADEHGRQAFVQVATGQHEVREYRFQGHLGFGGKVRITAERWYVYYYSEDKNEERDRIVAATNSTLDALKRWIGENHEQDILVWQSTNPRS